ncbi:MAG TPA: NAD(P)-dependent alcohol dehydrogenase [Polyangiaceae bacterium]|jgi:NADPH:quinone reductase-like Zn-dependent oxidoreductase|nr:NAD(P)-dependent alcohol dehydrogenase [Polyangiaceae bacterium]
MRAVSLKAGFGIDALAFEDLPIPECGSRDVLIRVRAVSLNARDLMMVRGEYNPRQQLPLIICSDAVGEVVARGNEVKFWREGDRVCPIFAGLWQRGRLDPRARQSSLGGPLDGTLREYFLAHEDALVRAPAHLSHEAAACLPCAGVTAYRALVEFGQLLAGNSLVCIGTGGVSLFALRIAQALGVRVILTSRSSEKLARAAALGVADRIDTTQNPDWAKNVRALTHGEGVDHVLEVGGAGTMAQSLRAVKMGGTISVIGVLSGAKTELDLRPLLMQDVRMQGVFVGSKETFLNLVALCERHALEPDVDRVFAFDETRAAFEYLASGKQFGKVVIALG